MKKTKVKKVGKEDKQFPAQHLSEEDLLLVRQHLHNSAVEEYKKLVTVITELPLDQNHFAECLIHLRTGMLWFKEAVAFAPFKFTISLEKTEGSKEDPKEMDTKVEEDTVKH